MGLSEMMMQVAKLNENYHTISESLELIILWDPSHKFVINQFGLSSYQWSP